LGHFQHNTGDRMQFEWLQVDSKENQVHCFVVCFSCFKL